MSGTTQTGIAAAFPGESGTSEVTVTLFDSDGSEQHQASFTLQAGEHLAKFLNESPLFEGLGNFEGTAVIEASKPVSLVALRSDAGLLSTVSVVTPRGVTNANVLYLGSDQDADEEGSALRLGTDGSPILTLVEAGRAGIGTMSPGNNGISMPLMELVDNRFSRLGLVATDPENDVRFLIDARGDGSDQAQIATVSNHDLKFFTDNKFRMTIRASRSTACPGCVGIHTGDPRHTLHVRRSILADFALDAYDEGEVRFNVKTLAPTGAIPGSVHLGTYTPHALQFFSDSDPRMVLTAAGNLGVGAIGTQNVTNLLTVQQDSDTDPIADAWTTYSSRRWKADIRPLEGALGKVRSLRGVSYQSVGTGKKSIGLIAEEVGQIVPEVVQYEENGRDARSLDYSRLVALLVEAIKEQQEQIANGQAQIKDLQERLADPQDR
jgi:hypothetical protein